MKTIKECPFILQHKHVFFPEMLPIDYLQAVKLGSDRNGEIWAIKCIICEMLGPTIYTIDPEKGEHLAWQAWNNR